MRPERAHRMALGETIQPAQIGTYVCVGGPRNPRLLALARPLASQPVRHGRSVLRRGQRPTFESALWSFSTRWGWCSVLRHQASGNVRAVDMALPTGADACALDGAAGGPPYRVRKPSARLTCHMWPSGSVKAPAYPHSWFPASKTILAPASCARRISLSTAASVASPIST
jgi:hypothetical protein